MDYRTLFTALIILSLSSNVTSNLLTPGG